MSTGSRIDPNSVILSNKGCMKINSIEIAELKELEIKLTPDTKEIALMNSATKGEVNTSYKGTITFEINKLYSRFKPAILECAKTLQPFLFNLEATVYNPDESGEETIYISKCWIKGDVTLFALKSDTEFLSEKYEAGFQIENADFTDTIDDGEDDWESLS
jgi:hypothetical protein